jgi:hypothetical protein
VKLKPSHIALFPEVTGDDRALQTRPNEIIFHQSPNPMVDLAGAS